ncbi:Rieske 2Fe-2S family protein [Rhodoligotrophos appendicifer]|uniref:aromatic ring-hydroxylating oxygenase subunit alpha n=1 Tax=Rhodoligotrophos appendicifer TaxID=987056 RepID=UPI0011869AC0|nr:aromatic ring-hydroxylating dioxygenase subunit alpha [Rhodoligotrophos appendicifer]
MTVPRDLDCLADATELVLRRRPGYSLEAPFYLSEALFKLDMDAIFARHWLHVGVEADVPQPGDFCTLEIGSYSIVIVRGLDGEARAFHNVCRHRGARVISAEKGSATKLVCPYHSWAYDLTGGLAFAEHMAPDIDRDCLGLKRVHLRTVGGLIFVCLAEFPPDDFDEMALTVEPYFGPHDLKNCKLAYQVDIIEDGNWKAVMENNRECYHCSGHPELMRTFFQFFGHSESDVKPRQQRYYERYCRIRGEMSDIWDSLGLPSTLVELLDDRATAFRLERMALDNAGESYTSDTRIACQRLLGDIGQPRLGALSLHTQPNSWNHVVSDHAVISFILPLSAEKTLLRTKWLVHKDAVEGRDYDVDRLTEVWRKTNEQDAGFVALISQGVRSPAYEPGPYSPNENQLEKFLTWYIDRLKSHLGIIQPMVPPPLGEAQEHRLSS